MDSQKCFPVSQLQQAFSLVQWGWYLSALDTFRQLPWITYFKIKFRWKVGLRGFITQERMLSLHRGYYKMFFVSTMMPQCIHGTVMYDIPAETKLNWLLYFFQHLWRHDIC
jgi:hypothetical protein